MSVLSSNNIENFSFLILEINNSVSTGNKIFCIISVHFVEPNLISFMISESGRTSFSTRIKFSTDFRAMLCAVKKADSLISAILTLSCDSGCLRNVVKTEVPIYCCKGIHIFSVF